MSIDGVVYGLDFEKARISCDNCSKMSCNFLVKDAPDEWICRVCGHVHIGLKNKIKALSRPLPITKKYLTIEDYDAACNTVSPTDKIDTEESLVCEALVREIRDAKRWSAVLEACEALLSVKAKADNLRREALIHNKDNEGKTTKEI